MGPKAGIIIPASSTRLQLRSQAAPVVESGSWCELAGYVNNNSAWIFGIEIGAESVGIAILWWCFQTQFKIRRLTAARSVESSRHTTEMQVYERRTLYDASLRRAVILIDSRLMDRP